MPVANKQMNREEITEAKRRLYLVLLKAQAGELSTVEVEIMYQLSLDQDMQAILSTAKAQLKVKPPST